jgi:uncharacterized protein YndB with AHSA1/START domain
MVDVDRQLDAVTRTVSEADQDTHLMRVNRLEQDYASDIDDVWNAITTADRIARWFMPVEGDLELGGRYQLVGNAGGTIESCTPPADGSAGYRVTWEFAGGVTWVEVSLRQLSADSTRLALTHLARAEDIPPGFWEQFGPGATGVGWDLGLLGLGLYLASDTSVPPEQSDEWMVSDEGRRFTRGAADAWARAHVASGADPAAASSAADAAYAFFTGQS